MPEDREPGLEDAPETDMVADDRDDEEDFRRVPRRLSGPGARVAKEYEVRVGGGRHPRAHCQGRSADVCKTLQVTAALTGDWSHH